MGFMDNFADNVSAAHGKADEIAALLAQHSQQLEQVINRLDAQLEINEYIRKTGAAIVAADGTAEIALTVNAGFIVRLQGFAISAALAAGQVAFYLGDSSNPQNLLEARAIATLLQSGTFPIGTVLPENVTLITRFTGQTAAATVTVAVTADRLQAHVPVVVPGVPY